MIVRSQSFVRLSDLFERADGNSKSGQLNIIQDPALDTLINRYILANEIQEEKNNLDAETITRMIEKIFLTDPGRKLAKAVLF